MQIKRRYDPSVSVLSDTVGDTMTQQHMANDANINQIVSKFQRTGQVPVNQMQPMYGDFSSSVDFHGAKNAILAVSDLFADLPSAVRKRFNHDPGQLIDFVMDSNNRQEAIELGLIDAVPVPAPAPDPAPVPVPESQT